MQKERYSEAVEISTMLDPIQNGFIQMNILSTIAITAVTSQLFCVQHNHLPLPHLLQSFATDFSFMEPVSLSIWRCTEAEKGVSRGCMLGPSEGTPARSKTPQPASSEPRHITPRKRVHQFQHVQTLTCSGQDGCYSNRNSVSRQKVGPLDQRRLFGTPGMLGEGRDMN